MLTLLCVAGSTLPAGAQQVRLTGTITYVRSYESPDEPQQMPTACPGCKVGTPVRLDFTLRRPDCESQGSLYACGSEGAYQLDPGSAPNRFTLTIGDRSWSQEGGSVVLRWNEEKRETSILVTSGSTGIHSGAVPSLLEFGMMGRLPLRIFEKGRIVPNVSGRLPTAEVKGGGAYQLVGADYALKSCAKKQDDETVYTCFLANFNVVFSEVATAVPSPPAR